MLGEQPTFTLDEIKGMLQRMNDQGEDWRQLDREALLASLLRESTVGQQVVMQHGPMSRHEPIQHHPTKQEPRQHARTRPRRNSTSMNTRHIERAAPSRVNRPASTMGFKTRAHTSPATSSHTHTRRMKTYESPRIVSEPARSVSVLETPRDVRALGRQGTRPPPGSMHRVAWDKTAHKQYKKTPYPRERGTSG